MSSAETFSHIVQHQLTEKFIVVTFYLYKVGIKLYVTSVLVFFHFIQHEHEHILNWIFL